MGFCCTHFSLSKQDSIDIDNFAEYERMAKKVVEEKPTKFSVYVNLDDVKTAATRVCMMIIICDNCSFLSFI